MNRVDNDVEAFIKDSNDTNSSDVRGVNATAGGITLTATDSTEAYAQAGAVSVAWQKPGNTADSAALSIGASAAINRIGSVSGSFVKAFVDNSAVTARDAISVTATASGKMHALAVGGSVSNATAGPQEESALSGSIAGAYGENLVTQSILAYFQAASKVKSTGGKISLLAQDLTKLIRADAYGIAVAFAEATNPEGVGVAVGIGIGLAHSKSKKTIQAYIDSSKVDAMGGDVDVEADSKAEVSTLAIGIAAAVAIGGNGSAAFAGAGSASWNEIDNTVGAYIKNSGGTNHVQSTTGEVNLQATDGSGITGDAGGFAIALNKAGVGGGKSLALALGISIALNDIGEDGGQSTSAYIENSAVLAATNVKATAISTATITAYAVGGSLSGSANSGPGITGNFAGVGVGTSNNIQQTVDSHISTNSIVTATGGSAVLTARDSSEIHADAGGVAIAIAAATGGGNGVSGSIGVAIAENTLQNTITAYVDHAKVTAKAVAITAESKKDPGSSSEYRIDALAFGVAGSGAGASGGAGNAGALAGAGSGSHNKIDNSIKAYIQDSNGTQGVTTTAGALTISANDDSSIRSDSGGYAVGVAINTGGEGAAVAAAIGASESLNEIGANSGQYLQAFIDNSAISAAGAVSLLANSTLTVRAQAIAGAGGVGGGTGEGLSLSLAGAGVGTVNSISSQILASIQNGSSVTALSGGGNAGDVAVNAIDTSTISAEAVGAAISVGVSGGGNSGSLSIGAAVSQNQIANKVTGQIDSSTVSASGALSMQGTETPTITATSVAASLSIAAANMTGIAISGGGASAQNTILSDAKALITGSTVSTGGAADVISGSTSHITASVTTVSLAGGGGTENGGAGAIGASIARNYIGFNSDGSLGSSKIQSQISDSSLTVGGTLTETATSSQTIESTVVAFTAAVAGAPDGFAFGLSGSGVETTNKIGEAISSTISGDGATGVSAAAISVGAIDESTITAGAGAASVAVSVTGGAVGGSLSIGVALARNEIDNSVEASISDALKLQTTASSITLTASETSNITATSVAASIAAGFASGNAGVGISGAGAESTNVLLTKTNAFILDCDIQSADAVSLTSTFGGTIHATVVGVSVAVGVGGDGGVGASIGAAVARNLIGYNSGSANNTVGTEDMVQAQAYLQGTSLSAAGALTATATSTPTIIAEVGAGSMAIGGGSDVGVGLSGSGVLTQNKIATKVEAYIEGDGTKGITVDSAAFSATDISHITAKAGAASLAAAPWAMSACRFRSAFRSPATISIIKSSHISTTPTTV